MNYEDGSEFPFNILFKKIEELKEIGFSKEEASRFARLQFRDADRKVVLSAEEEEALALFKEKQETLLSVLTSGEVISNIEKIERNGFSTQEAKEFASFLYRSKSQNPLLALSKNQEGKLMEYKKRYKELSPESYFDITGEELSLDDVASKDSNRSLPNNTTEGANGLGTQESKLVKSIKHKSITSQPLNSAEQAFLQAHRELFFK